MHDEFYFGYYSEVSTVVSVEVIDNVTVLSATHPTEGVGIGCWFHFNGSYNGTDPLVIEDKNPNKALYRLGDTLYPGAKVLLDKWENVDSPRQKFFTDLYLAFISGHWYPPSGDEWEHDIGAEITERFK